MNSLLAPVSLMSTLLIMAQMGEIPAGLADRGAMGLMLVWLMWRVEKRFEALAVTISGAHDKSSNEVRAMRHSFDGFQRSMLIVEANRQDANPALRKAAQEMLAKIEARERA